MALFPEWLLRSVRRDSFTDNPVLAIEKLNSLSRPLQDADKEILVGAVLTMSASLTLALSMLQELLPQERSRERLGEVLCPTLGQLFSTLQSLPSFEPNGPEQTTEAPTVPPADTLEPATPRFLNGRRNQSSPKPNQLTAAAGSGQQAPARLPVDRPASSSTGTSQSPRARTRTEGFPPLENSATTRHLHVEVDIHARPEMHLAHALQTERRVQAAIHVAIESLEFAEGQLKVIKVGGNYDLLQRHFYEGYNRLLFRALELQQQELGLLAGRESWIPATTGQQQLNGDNATQSTPKQQQSVSFQTTLSPSATLRTNGMAHPAYSERRPLGRRNTIQGIRHENPRISGKPPLKRRLSLAAELSLVGEDSESYQDETASSASELEESDPGFFNDHRHMMNEEEENEEYSTNGESASEGSIGDSEDGEDCEDKTIEVSRTIITSANHSRSRLPRFHQPRR